jgi:hypothetical protein
MDGILEIVIAGAMKSGLGNVTWTINGRLASLREPKEEIAPSAPA